MAEETVRPGRVDRELVGERIPIGERMIQPVARLVGWAGGQSGPQGGGGGGWLQVRPVEVVVYEADGTESSVPIVDANAQAIRGMVTAGVAVAGVCVAIMAIRRLAAHAG